MKTFDDNIYFEVADFPAVITTGTYPATYIDVTDYDSFVFVWAGGATDNTIDMKVVQATDSAGTGSKDVTSAAITQLAGTDDNEHVSIQVETSRLDIANDFRFVAATVTIAGTTTGAVLFFGLNPRHAPVTQPAAYSQQVVVAG